MSNASHAAKVIPEVKINDAQAAVLERLLEGKPLGNDEWAVIEPITYEMGLHRAKTGFWGLFGEVTGLNDLKRMFRAKGTNNKIGGALSGGLKAGAIGYGGYRGGKFLWDKFAK